MTLSRRTAAVIFALGLALSACGSDGGSAIQPERQPATPEPTPSTLALDHDSATATAPATVPATAPAPATATAPAPATAGQVDGNAVETETSLTWEFTHRVETVDTPTETVVDTTVPTFPDDQGVQAAIDTFVAGEIDPWIVYAKEVDTDTGAAAGEYTLLSDVTLNSSVLVSIEFEYYEYACCRPHPNYGYRGLTVEPETGRVLEDGEIVDLSRQEEITEVFLAALTASGALGDSETIDVFASYLESPAWSSLSVQPDGLIFGTARTGPFPATRTVVPFSDLGDLVFSQIVEAATQDF